jgi:DNA polymerase III subunit delta
LIFQTLEELEGSLRGDSAKNVFLILGPELYLCQMAVDLLKRKFLSPESMGFDYAEFSVDDTSVEQIVEAANTFPMISKKRFVLVAGAGKLKDAEQDTLLSSMNSLSPRSVLVFLAEDLDHRKKFYKAMREKHIVAEFAKLKAAALEKWASSFMQGKGYRCTSSAIKRIVDLAGSDLQTLAAELEKLILFAGSDKNISDDAVRDLVGSSRQQGIFDFIGAVGRRDCNSALRSLANLLSMGEHPLVVVTMLARHCRQVLVAKEYLAQGLPSREIASAAQIPPFILDNFLRQAKAVEGETVQRMCIRLAEIDRRLKSSSADGRILLEQLICALV